jgi:hypothetical protein
MKFDGVSCGKKSRYQLVAGKCCGNNDLFAPFNQVGKHRLAKRREDKQLCHRAATKAYACSPPIVAGLPKSGWHRHVTRGSQEGFQNSIYGKETPEGSSSAPMVLLTMKHAPTLNVGSGCQSVQDKRHDSNSRTSSKRPRQH